ncbi:MAG: hypothetical protein ACYS9C_18680 [Planctomycetota bacterium]
MVVKRIQRIGNFARAGHPYLSGRSNQAGHDNLSTGVDDFCFLRYFDVLSDT